MHWLDRDAPLVFDVCMHMKRDPRRYYHNWQHVSHLLNHAHKAKMDFDVDLFEAILGHDVVYDEFKDKEQRSIDWMVACPSAVCSESTMQHILKTIKHELSDDNRMVLLDLMDFRYPGATRNNFALLVVESMSLYDVDLQQVVVGGIEALTRIRDQYTPSELKNVSYADGNCFREITHGITDALYMYEGLKI